MFSCNCFFLLISSLFLPSLCWSFQSRWRGRRYRTKGKNEWIASCVVLSAVWQADVCMSSFPYHLRISFWEAVWYADIDKVTLLWNLGPLSLMHFFSHCSFNIILLQRTWELCLSLPSLKFWIFSFLNYLKGLLRQFLEHRCCCEELVKLYHSCFFMGA